MTLWSIYIYNILHLARRLLSAEITKTLFGDKKKMIFSEFRSLHRKNFEFIILAITEADDLEEKVETLVIAKFGFVSSTNALRE